MDLVTLIGRARQHDLEAFAEITRRFQHMAFGYALSILRDLGQAEDVVQEAFVAAWFGLGRLEDPAAFPRLATRHCPPPGAPRAATQAPGGGPAARRGPGPRRGGVRARRPYRARPARGHRARRRRRAARAAARGHHPLLRARVLAAGHRHIPGPAGDDGEQPSARRARPAQAEGDRRGEGHARFQRPARRLRRPHRPHRAGARGRDRGALRSRGPAGRPHRADGERRGPTAADHRAGRSAAA
jgi:hypothetical protein